ncbi:MAG: aminotransferase class V-fold PLP-dependent enzyme [Candidatus Nanopelagicaceae bacterium]|nr:aminotransferase class V-fold PLP-dependent enzyme [Candidatus Nanopelagicaceae bacterium]
MSPITERDFQSEEPLHPAAEALLSEFFSKGWPDPSKIHQQSARLRNLIATAKESIASNLGVESTELEFVGELGFGFQTAIAGLLHNRNKKFFLSAVDRQVVHAFAREHQDLKGELEILQPDDLGVIDFDATTANSIVSWQSVNRETGVRQELATPRENQLVFADMTADTELKRIPTNWSSALWDPRLFRGPQGIAIIGISNRGGWKNPGPQIDKRRVYGSYSKPLLLACAVALENWLAEKADRDRKLSELNDLTRKLLVESIPGVRVAGDPSKCDARYLAFSIPNVIAEEVLRKVEQSGFLIDAGSACGGGAMEPSHVLTAMGFGIDGNFRVTFKTEQSQDSVKELISVLLNALN